MAGRHSKRGKGMKVETPDLDLMPMLNVFISIIPMLLLSAAFVQLNVIETGLPTSVAAAVPAEPRPDATPPVRIFIRAAEYVVESDGSPPRAISRGESAGAARDAGRLQLEALLRTIATRSEKKPEVLIVPGIRTRYEEIIFVMDLAREAGLPQAALADAEAGAV